MQNPSYKIFVAYHMPAPLPQGEHYIPIHCGRALGAAAHKDGELDPFQYEWLIKNTHGDDEGDTISLLNRHFNEMTAVYYAWKNYEKCGNPDYIGLCHYRRIIPQEHVIDVQDFDIIAQYESFDVTVVEQFYTSHHTDTLLQVFEKVKKIKGYENVVTECMQKTAGFYRNIFVMKKALFFEYCSFIFPLLFDLHEQTDYTKLSFYGQRMPAFIAERLTSLFIHKTMMEGKNVQKMFIDIGFTPAIYSVAPAFAEHNVPVVFSADKEQAPYLCAAIASLTHHADARSCYDISIVCKDFSDEIRHKILEFASPTVSIRFFDIRSLVATSSGVSDLFDEDNPSLEHVLLLIVDYFTQYQKIVYLSYDSIILDDVAKLYHEDMHGFGIAAVHDIKTIHHTFNQIEQNTQTIEHMQNTLGILNPRQYFSTHVMLVNIEQCKHDFIQQYVEKYKNLHNQAATSQDIFNSMLNNNIHYLDNAWNVACNDDCFDELYNSLPNDVYVTYQAAQKHPRIVHYMGATKPWHAPQMRMAHIWWKYSRMTLFYEEILYDQARLQLSNGMNTYNEEALKRQQAVCCVIKKVSILKHAIKKLYHRLF